MLITIADVFAPEAVARFNAAIASGAIEFRDGSATAGWAAKAVKHNEQAAGPALAPLLEKARQSILGNALFKAAAQPKALQGVLLSRYLPGMEYGLHVDDALMNGVRTDLSFTLFLSPSDSYDGGALVIEGNDGETEIKLDAGSLVLYPATSLHRVSAVKHGERLAVVGWVRSYIRSHEHRGMLFDLENVIAQLRLAKAGPELLNPMLKLRANLLRNWAEN